MVLLKHDTDFAEIMTDATDGSADIECDGFASCIIQAYGCNGTVINVLGTTGGDIWDALAVINLTTVGVPTGSIAADGLYGVSSVGLIAIRVTIVTNSGRITIRYGLSTGSAEWPYLCYSWPQ